MKLLHRLEGINKEFSGHATRSNYWHAQLLRAQVRLRSSCHILGSRQEQEIVVYFSVKRRVEVMGYLVDVSSCGEIDKPNINTC